MKLFKHNVYFNDFIPPIIPKVLHTISRKNKVQEQRLHPFESVPNEIKAKWILDIGANIGDVTKSALISYPESNVICFEPVSSTFQTLKKNLSNYSERVFLFNKALSDKQGTAEINITSFHGANSLEQQSKFHKHFNPQVKELSKETIEITRLDDISNKFPTNYIDILKIDVEGHELSVLKGGTEFISKHVDTIICEIALQRDETWQNQSIFEIFSLLHSLGFCLINCVDLHYSKNSNLMLVQMDCVFRHQSRL